jgi:hypothetical protein
MRIESFWAKGFRSLRDVELKDLGAFNVFYGPNGSGKSNILEAMKALRELARVAAMHSHLPGTPCVHEGQAAVQRGLIQRRDLYARDDSRTIVLGAQYGSDKPGTPILSSGPLSLTDLTIEVTLDWIVRAEPKLLLSRLESNGEDLRGPNIASEHIRELLAQVFPSRAFNLVGATRFPWTETRIDLGAQVHDGGVIPWLLGNGSPKNALLLAQISPNAAIRRRLNDLRSLLSGPPLHRPPFDPVQDPETNRVELHERLPEPNPQGLEIPIDLAGLGVVQIYVILAHAMLSEARVVGIEEPEAHLHAPTTGRHLRELLERLVNEKHIDQLFIATHSNLFDLDPTGYFDVSLKDGETVVERADLTRIDRDHLYEPGPAKHALQRMLEYMPPGEVMFRRGDGSPVSVAEMLELLQNDDPLAVDFLRDVHGAAITMVRVAKKKGK